MFNFTEITGIGEYTSKKEKKDDHTHELFLKDDKAFLVVNPKTIELRTDNKLKNLLVEKYESVMESRYFGRGGIEIVLAGNQLTRDELDDLIRLSYNLS